MKYLLINYKTLFAITLTSTMILRSSSNQTLTGQSNQVLQGTDWFEGEQTEEPATRPASPVHRSAFTVIDTRSRGLTPTAAFNPANNRFHTVPRSVPRQYTPHEEFCAMLYCFNIDPDNNKNITWDQLEQHAQKRLEWVEVRRGYFAPSYRQYIERFRQIRQNPKDGELEGFVNLLQGAASY